MGFPLWFGVAGQAGEFAHVDPVRQVGVDHGEFHVARGIYDRIDDFVGYVGYDTQQAACFRLGEWVALVFGELDFDESDGCAIVVVVMLLDLLCRNCFEVWDLVDEEPSGRRSDGLKPCRSRLVTFR